MKKWYNEEYQFEIEVTGFLRGDKTEGYCRNGEEIWRISAEMENIAKISYALTVALFLGL